MNGFKKLLLTTAILAASSNAMALQAMDDESLAGTTGQDGITIVMDTDITTDITWVDRSGTGAGQYTNAGALLINNVNISSTGLTIDIDAGGNTLNTNGLLNIGISNPNAIVIDLSATTIQVGDGTGVTDAATAVSGVAGATTIVSFGVGANLTIAGGVGRVLDIQLGNEVDNFITLNGSLGDITLTGMNIIDTNGGVGADISIGTLTLSGIDLVNASVNVVPAGLSINTGTGLTAVGVGIERLALGDETLLNNGFIGDVFLSGLDISNNTITVSGH